MRICIIGNSGHGMTVFSALELRSGLEIGAYCEGYPGEDLLALEMEFQRRGLSPVRYPDYRSMLAAGAWDVAVVDGMFCDHATMAMEALEMGIHVYCDKPVATTLSDLARLRETAGRSKALLWGMMTARYDPWFYTAKQYIDQGAVGKIRLLNGQKSYKLGTRPPFFGSRESFGGLTSWVAIHPIDLFLWITGKRCRSIFSRQDCTDNFGNGDLEMTSLCLLELEDHILAQTTADYYRPAAASAHGDDRLRVVGTEGILEVWNNTVHLIDGDGERELPLLASPDVFVDFVDTLRESGHPVPVDCGALYSTEVCLLARESA